MRSPTPFDSTITIQLLICVASTRRTDSVFGYGAITWGICGYGIRLRTKELHGRCKLLVRLDDASVNDVTPSCKPAQQRRPEFHCTWGRSVVPRTCELASALVRSISQVRPLLKSDSPCLRESLQRVR